MRGAGQRGSVRNRSCPEAGGDYGPTKVLETLSSPLQAGLLRLHPDKGAELLALTSYRRIMAGVLTIRKSDTASGHGIRHDVYGIPGNSLATPASGIMGLYA